MKRITVNARGSALAAVTRARALIELDLLGSTLTSNRNFLKSLGYDAPALQAHGRRVQRSRDLH